MYHELPSFDSLRDMATRDPDALERLRIRLSDQIIQDAPPSYRRRLRGLQFRIEMEIRRARSPMAACITLSGMMHDSFDKLRKAINDACLSGQPAIAGNHSVAVQADVLPAKVLPFRRKA